MASDIDMANGDPVQDFMSDCRLMLRFARKNGTELPPELEHEIAHLDSILTALKLPPVSDIPSILISNVPWPAGVEPPKEPLPAGPSTLPAPATTTELVLRVHGELSKVIAPATALSLQTTEPPPTGHTFFGGMPLVVKAAALAALLCAAGFVTSAGVIASKAADDARVAQQKAEISAEQNKKIDDKKKPAESEGEKK